MRDLRRTYKIQVKLYQIFNRCSKEDAEYMIDCHLGYNSY